MDITDITDITNKAVTRLIEPMWLDNASRLDKVPRSESLSNPSESLSG